MFPSPIGATIPAFVLTFVLYGLAMWRERTRHPREDSTHLADVASAEPADA